MTHTRSAGQEPAAEPAHAQRLLDGLARAIDERGFRDTTIADIVRYARTSRRTFYQYFSSKEECFIALLRQANGDMARAIEAAVDRHAPWQVQIGQAVEAWLTAAQAQPSLTLSWIRELPSLGAVARQLQRDTMAEFVTLIEALLDNEELRAAGITAPPRPTVVMLLAGLRELIAMVVEDGGRIDDIKDVAVDATVALLGPRGDA